MSTEDRPEIKAAIATVIAAAIATFSPRGFFWGGVSRSDLAVFVEPLGASPLHDAIGAGIAWGHNERGGRTPFDGARGETSLTIDDRRYFVTAIGGKDAAKLLELWGKPDPAVRRYADRHESLIASRKARGFDDELALLVVNGAAREVPFTSFES